jgi:hypothetical protein
VPSQLLLVVRDTAGVARNGEVVRSGVPLPRALAVTDLADLTLVDAGGAPVPAQFHVQARWHAAIDDTTAPIQWLLVVFAATVPADGEATYRLVTDGSAGPNPPPAQPVTVTQNGNQLTVDTGAARFVLGGSPGSLFDEVRLANGTVVVDASTMSATAEGTSRAHATLRAVAVEQQGPLSVVVTVAGAYDMPPVGGGGLGSRRRYVFAAGSPTAIVRHVVAWEGDRCGMDAFTCGATVNGLLLTSVRDTLHLALGPNLGLTAVGAFASPARTGSASTAQSAAVRQRLRASRAAPLLFEVALPAAPTTTGAKADGALLAASGPAGAVAIALDHMHRYEPQALRLLAGGTLAVEVADDSVWLANRQGLYATFAVSALPAAPGRATLDEEVWAPLNHPLRAWPQPQWWAASEAVEELPVGALPTSLADYDTLIPAVLATTLSRVDSVGTSGLTTYGLFPRNWGDPLYADEVDCGFDQDPTPSPADEWDDKFWCSTWTDYHNAAATAAIWAMRSGEVEWLDEITTPAALRSLHTQRMECAPGDAFFFCGQYPTGYGAYRSDNNGSHAYLDNVVLHSFLSGDDTAASLLLGGARSMRGFLCPGRGGSPPGPPCAPTDPLVDPWAAVNGRAAVQWYGAFRYLGLTTDVTFLDDWSSGLARHLTLYHAEPLAAGAQRAFNVPAGGGTTDYIDAPGTYPTTQLWMDGLYDHNTLHRYRVDAQDAPLGQPALQPSTVGRAWARTLAAVSTANPWSTGGPDGPWPNALQFTFSGDRIGGAMTSWVASVDRDGDGTPCELNDDDDDDPNTWGDPCLYNTGKGTLGASLLRAADDGGDPAWRVLGRAFAEFSLQSAMQSAVLPLGKNNGILLSRLHAAVARAAGGALLVDGFESGTLGAWSSAAGAARHGEPEESER